jgi:membrane protein
MVWINVNIHLILLGNELNIAIKNVRVRKMEKDQKRILLEQKLLKNKEQEEV